MRKGVYRTSAEPAAEWASYWAYLDSCARRQRLRVLVRELSLGLANALLVPATGLLVLAMAMILSMLLEAATAWAAWWR